MTVVMITSCEFCVLLNKTNIEADSIRYADKLYS